MRKEANKILLIKLKQIIYSMNESEGYTHRQRNDNYVKQKKKK